MEAALIASAEAGVAVLLRNASPAPLTSDGTPWAPASTHAATPHHGALTIHKAAVPGSSLARFRAVCTLPHAPAAVARFVGACGPRLAWDRNVAGLDTVVLAAEGGPPQRAAVVLLRSSTKPVGPVSAREFVDVVRTAAVGRGVYVNGGAGVADVDDPRFPPRPGFLRGYNSPGSGWVFEPAAGAGGRAATRVSYLIHSDLRGWLPSLVVNAALTGAFEAFFADLGAAMAAPGSGVGQDEGQAEALAALAEGAGA